MCQASAERMFTSAMEAVLVDQLSRKASGPRSVNVAKSRGYPSILIFGSPGSGKGTQGAILGRMPNLIHVAMGDIFRALDKQSDIGKEFLSHSSEGSLVPDELTIRLFQQHVDGMIKDGHFDERYHTLILDGIPRTSAQVTLLESVLDVQKVVHLKMVDNDALIARLVARAAKSNRPDDADRTVIKNRLEVYERETAPVLAAYHKKLIARVNGDQPPLAVLRDIADCLVGVISPNI